MNELTDIKPIHTPALDALEREFARLAAADAAVRTARHAGMRAPRRWRLRVAATGVAGLAAALAVAVLSLGGVQPTSASALERAADAAASGSAAGLLAPGQFWYVRMRSDDQHAVFESWQDAAGQQRLRRTPLDSAGAPALDRTQASSGFALGLFDYDELRALPTDPQALLARIGEAIRGNSTWSADDGSEPLASNELLAIALLLDAPGTPELRAGLFRAAALIPGVHDAGAVTDPLGRAGEAVVHDAPDGSTSVRLTFDPDTGALLSLQSGRASFVELASGAVDAAGALPTGVTPVSR
jgi:hypothetical protein